MRTILAALVTGALAAASDASHYVAAVVEHTTYTADDTPENLLEVNLKLYEQLATLARSKGAEVIVYPEFGLTPLQDGQTDNRSALYPFVERIPLTGNPCVEGFVDSPILTRMSCSARSNGLLSLVNMIDKVDCVGEVSCPDDGAYQYNTNVLFDEEGNIVAKYHKSHEWPPFIPVYDEPASPSQVTYNWSRKPGVEFGIFTCFDIMFVDPAETMSKRGIKHFLYPVAQGSAGEKTLIEPWSRDNEAAILASKYGSGRHDCSVIAVNGTAVPSSTKYHLSSTSGFPDENVLIATVPVVF